MIKGDTWTNDFLYQAINDAFCLGSDELFGALEKAERDGTSLTMDFHCEGRDGMFDEDQLFAVWERPDVLSLIQRLQETLDPEVAVVGAGGPTFRSPFPH
jgi:hypothetical protein